MFALQLKCYGTSSSNIKEFPWEISTKLNEYDQFPLSKHRQETRLDLCRWVIILILVIFSEIDTIKLWMPIDDFFLHRGLVYQYLEIFTSG